MFWHGWCWLLRMDLSQPSFEALFSSSRDAYWPEAGVVYFVLHILIQFLQLDLEAIYHLNSPPLHNQACFLLLFNISHVHLYWHVLMASWHDVWCDKSLKICALIGRDGAGDDPCDQSGNGDVLGNVTLESDGNHGESQSLKLLDVRTPVISISTGCFCFLKSLSRSLDESKDACLNRCCQWDSLTLNTGRIGDLKRQRTESDEPFSQWQNVKRRSVVCVQWRLVSHNSFV